MIYTTTSTTSLSTSVGTKFLTVGAGLGWLPSQWVKIQYDSNTNLQGTITSYNNITGNLVALINIVNTTALPAYYSPWTVSITCGYPPYNLTSTRIDGSMIRERKYLPTETGYSSSYINNPELPAVNAKEGLASVSSGITPIKIFTNSNIDWKLIEDLGQTNSRGDDPSLPRYWDGVPNRYYYYDSTGVHEGLPPGLVASFCWNFVNAANDHVLVPPITGKSFASAQTNPPYVWISGTPTAAEHYQIHFSYPATGTLNNDFYVADILVFVPQISLTAATNTPPNGIKNTNYNHTFEVTNPEGNGITLTNVSYTSSNFSIPGLTFEATTPTVITPLANGGTSTAYGKVGGVISGVPTTPGTYSFTLTVTFDGGSASFTKTIIIYSAPPKITSTNNITGATVGTLFSFPVVAAETSTNSAATSFTATGLPTGLSINATTGVISGTPQSVVAIICTSNTNDFPIVITASNTGRDGVQTDTQNAIIHIVDTTPPIITDVALGTESVITSATGNRYANSRIYYNQAIIGYQVEATNCPTQFIDTGLPIGLVISNLPSTPGIISGTPTTPGAYLLSVAARNKYGQSASAITIIVGWPHPIINVDSNGVPTTLDTEWVVGYTLTGTGQTVTATNSPQNFALANAPVGVAISNAGVLSGTPSVIGKYIIAIAADNIGLFPAIPGYYPESAGTANWSLGIFSTPSEIIPIITSFTLPDETDVYEGIGGYFTIDGIRGEEIGDITVNHEHKITGFSLSGQPPGITVNATTGVISGIPTAIGTFVATYTATNRWTPLVAPGTGVTVTIHFVIKFPSPVITSSTYTYGIIGETFDPPVAYGGGVPAGYHITASYDDADVIVSYAASMPSLAFNQDTGFGLSVNTTTGVISGIIPPDVVPGNYTITVSAINQGSHDAVPADSEGPGTAAINLYLYGPTPQITNVSPDLISDSGGIRLTITGKNFVSGATVWFGNMSFVIGTEVDFESSQSLTVIAPALAVATTPYDVVVQNPDGQTALAREALTVMNGDVFITDQVHYTSLLNTEDSPIYAITNTNSSSIRKKRIFGLGTNVEVLFYSGVDVGTNTILNVYRKQIGTTSTRHGAGDIVFKGVASIQISPFMYKAAANGRISQINCLLRSDGKIEMSIKMFDGTTYDEQGELFYANHQTILVKEISLLPIPKIGTSECD